MGENSHVQMRLPVLLRISYPLFQDPLCFLNVLPMQVNRVIGHPPRGIVLSEDEIRRLLIILVHQGRMPLAFFREIFCRGAISFGVRFLGLLEGNTGR